MLFSCNQTCVTCRQSFSLCVSKQLSNSGSDLLTTNNNCQMQTVIYFTCQQTTVKCRRWWTFLIHSHWVVNVDMSRINTTINVPCQQHFRQTDSRVQSQDNVQEPWTCMGALREDIADCHLKINKTRSYVIILTSNSSTRKKLWEQTSRCGNYEQWQINKQVNVSLRMIMWITNKLSLRMI